MALSAEASACRSAGELPLGPMTPAPETGWANVRGVGKGVLESDAPPARGSLLPQVRGPGYGGASRVLQSSDARTSPSFATVSSPAEIGFDLSRFAWADRAWKQGRLVFVLAILLGFGGELVALLWAEHALLLGGGWVTPRGELAVILLAGLSGVIGFGLVGLPRLLPGAGAVRLDATGVHLIYRGGRQEHLRWADRVGFVLQDYRGSPEMVSQDLAFRLHGPRFWSRRTLLPAEVLESILAEARHHDVEIAEHLGSVARYGFVPRTYEIRSRPLWRMAG